MTRTAFDPRIHGFAFPNRYRGGEVVAELARQERLSELTGVKIPRGVGALADLASGQEFWGSFGLCGGMSWAALDRFRAGEAPPATTTIPNGGDELFGELVGRQADSMRGRELIERCLVWQLLPDRAPWWMFWSRGVARLTIEREWPSLRETLDSGLPMSLVLIRARGAANPSGNHQVVAIGYEIGDDETIDIHLYDPNHPGSTPTIPLDRRAGTVGPRQSTGEPVRGFFVW